MCSTITDRTHAALDDRRGAPRSAGKRGSERWPRYGANVARFLPRRKDTAAAAAGEEEPPALRLLVVDPRSLTRGCLVAAMRGAHGIGAITAVSGMKEALEHAEAGAAFDAVLTNVPPEAFDGGALVELSPPVRMALDDAAVIILTTSVDPAHILAVFHQGARGYLTIDMPVDLMVEAIRLVAAGWAIHPPVDLDALAETSFSIDSVAMLTAKLTHRQAEVLRYLATGMPNKNIAFHLGLSERTVKAHVQEIMQRIGAANRTQIVALLGGSRLESVGEA